jgi:hypothetical protein
MIISEQPQTVNSVLLLRFDLPDMQLFKAAQLDIAARVAHCEPDINPAFYNIGFEFLDVRRRKSDHRTNDGCVRIQAQFNHFSASGFANGDTEYRRSRNG